MIIGQVNQDNDVGSLLMKMNEVYTFLTQADLWDIKSMKTVVACICKQTLECSYFIQKYAQDTKFRKSVCRYVNEFTSRFKERGLSRIFFPIPTSVCELTITPLIRSCSSSVIGPHATR